MLPPFVATALLAQVGSVLTPTTDMLVVFAVIVLALVFFVFELLPLDLTAVGVMVVLIVLEPWTDITPQEGLSGFSSTATITVLAMFVLSEGIRRSGLIRLVGNRIVDATRGSSAHLYAAVTGLSGGAAAFVNNTPVVAMMIPMVTDIAEKTRTSPSTYLMPVSYAAMMGGTLTLVGTSTNILASDISERLLGHPIGMFEFTHLGAVVLGTGLVYLFFVGRHLVPKRIDPQRDLTTDYDMERYLTEVRVRAASPLVGHTIEEIVEYDLMELDADVVHLTRDGETYVAPLDRKEVRAGDRLLIRTRRSDLARLLETEALEIVPANRPGAAGSDLGLDEAGDHLLEVVVLPETDLVGQTLEALGFQERFEAPVLAIRRGQHVLHHRLADEPLEGGDALLIMATDEAVDAIYRDNRFAVVEREGKGTEIYRTRKRLPAVVIVATVVLLAALGVVPILVSALGGMVAMVAAGCLKPNEVYRAVNWPVIFLLAGMIPLGMALEQTGGAAYLASLFTGVVAGWPPVLVLLAFYLFTALVTEVVSNNASVVLMIPIAVEAAALIGAEPFAFVLAVTFAASTALLSPLGYQTNLMVYGPGGYRFTDFFRVGALLQLLLAVVTAGGIYLFWGV